jgi:hypothetical protein
MKTKEEIEQLAKEHSVKLNNDDDAIEFGFFEGYTQCQKDIADEKLDEDDINEMALDYIINTGGLPDSVEALQYCLHKFYQSLNK